MAIYYKLTDAEGWTRRDYPEAMHWEVGKTNKATGEEINLCTDGVLHFYRSPELAVFLNPVHAAIVNPRLWEVEGDEVVGDAVKGGARELTVLRELSLPEISNNARVRFAIYVIRHLFDCSRKPDWNKWAENWLSGEDRTPMSAKFFSLLYSGNNPLALVARAVRASARSSNCAVDAAAAVCYALLFKRQEEAPMLQRLLLLAIQDEAEFEAKKG